MANFDILLVEVAILLEFAMTTTKRRPWQRSFAPKGGRCKKDGDPSQISNKDLTADQIDKMTCTEFDNDV